MTRSRDGRLLASLGVAVVLVSYTAAFVVEATAQRLLEQDAQRIARDWTRFLSSNVPDFDHVFESGDLPPESLPTLRLASRAGRIVNYRLYDPEGDLVFSSDAPSVGRSRADVEAGRGAAYLPAGVLADEVRVDDGAGEGGGAPAVVGEAYAPVVEEGALLGVVEAQVDLTGQRAAYRSAFGRITLFIAALVVVAAGVSAYVVSRKIEERRLAEARADRLAHRDPLTGLPNRALLRNRLDQALGRIQRDGDVLAVLCLDVERFSEVNDAFGHATGDRLLEAVADRLLGILRAADTVARTGNDDFVVLQVGIKQPEGAAALAVRIQEAFVEPFAIDGHDIELGVCIGVAIAPDDGREPAGLLKHAGIALSRARAEGPGCYRFFEPAMDARLQARRRLEGDLRASLARDELELHYQPVHELPSRRIVGFEALIQWRHPVHGTMPPATFIPLAEELGLIVPIGAWVVHKACRDAATWPAPLRVAVNISPTQFRRDDVAALVADALDQSGLAPGRLELEVTEGLLLPDDGRTRSTVERLKKLGVRIAVDDFGTGYSSLGYLRAFQFDKIKIDRSFVSGLADGIDHPEDDATIVRAVLGLGRSLDMTTNAEGVETEEQLAYLEAHRCDEVQGFLLSRPVASDEVVRCLAGRGRCGGEIGRPPSVREADLVSPAE